MNAIAERKKNAFEMIDMDSVLNFEPLEKSQYNVFFSVAHVL